MKFAETNSRNIQDCFNLIYPEVLDTAEIAKYCKANKRTVGTWTKAEPGQLRIKKNVFRHKIEKLAAVVALMETELSFSPAETQEFLTTPHIDVDSADMRTYTMIDVLSSDPDAAPFVLHYAIEQSIDASFRNGAPGHDTHGLIHHHGA